jgi:tetratricopeptide (TPR) repeat protein
MSSKKKKPGARHGGPRPPSIPHELQIALDEARRLIARDRFADAVALLEPVARRYPNNQVVLHLLSDAAGQAGHWPVALDANERLAVLAPNEPVFQINRGVAHSALGFQLLALRYLQAALARWPDHSAWDQIRPLVDRLEQEVPQRLARLDVPPAEAAELEARHEQVQVWMERGKFAEARRVASQVLARWPRFVPALNNLAEAWFGEGNLSQAAAASRQALQVVPENAAGRANLVRFLALDGKGDEARREAAALRSQPVGRPEYRVKAAEALSVLGNDQGVLDVHAQAEQEGYQLSDEHLAWLHHMAGVAAYRLGDEARARTLWASALRALPSFSITRQNIDDLDEPRGEQNGPWAVWPDSFIPRLLLEELQRHCVRASVAASTAGLQAELQRLVRAHLHLVPTVPLLLDHGDPLGRVLAVRLAGTARTPELLAALRDFALGLRGPDGLRVQAAFSLASTNLLPPGEVRLWRQGAWQPTLVPRIEVTREATGKHGLSHRGEKLFREAFEALNEGDAATAEPLLRQVLLEQPNNSSLRHNLAHALMMQGREGEADDIMRALHREDPDYLFAAAHLAREQIMQGELDEVEPLLARFLQRPRMHLTEFWALGVAQVELAVARKQRDVAWFWLTLMEAVDPGNANLPRLRELIGSRPR